MNGGASGWAAVRDRGRRDRQMVLDARHLGMSPLWLERLGIIGADCDESCIRGRGIAWRGDDAMLAHVPQVVCEFAQVLRDDANVAGVYFDPAARDAAVWVRLKSWGRLERLRVYAALQSVDLHDSVDLTVTDNAVEVPNRAMALWSGVDR